MVKKNQYLWATDRAAWQSSNVSILWRVLYVDSLFARQTPWLKPMISVTPVIIIMIRNNIQIEVIWAYFLFS